MLSGSEASRNQRKRVENAPHRLPIAEGNDRRSEESVRMGKQPGEYPTPLARIGKCFAIALQDTLFDLRNIIYDYKI
jgi:hypothetical protein